MQKNTRRRVKAPVIQKIFSCQPFTRHVERFVRRVAFWCNKEILPGRRKPDVLRPDIVRYEGQWSNDEGKQQMSAPPSHWYFSDGLRTGMHDAMITPPPPSSPVRYPGGSTRGRRMFCFSIATCRRTPTLTIWTKTRYPPRRSPASASIRLALRRWVNRSMPTAPVATLS